MSTLDPSGSVLNIFELSKIRDEREVLKTTVYREVLKMCHSKIKRIADEGGLFCVYPVPDLVVGLPKFDHVRCMAYLMKKLRENGFIVRFTSPNLLYVSWEHVPSTYKNPEAKALEKQMITQPYMDYSNVFNKIYNKTKVNVDSLPPNSLQRIYGSYAVFPTKPRDLYRPIHDFKAPTNYISSLD